ncbi:MAG: [Fe-Fe] hydrogenase large subunit C-terminal domain-containing protein [Bacillota bacterium]
MEKRYENFEDKRLEIFRHLINKRWDDSLTTEDLNNIALEIMEKYDFEEEELPSIKDHIRVALGQDPNNRREFDDEIENIYKNNPVESPILTKIEGICQRCERSIEECDCADTCKYEAQMYVESSGPVIDDKKCLTCGRCTIDCNYGAFADKIEFIPIINFLEDDSESVFAAVAPSIVGQFGEKVSMGQIRTALMMMGFEDMVEVALFADILTIKEAYEFDSLVTTEKDFFLTSCCCPVWINLVKKNYPGLFEYMSPSISPMIASGKFLKRLYPDSKVVFIGPCTAKKSEAEQPGLDEEIDFVLTFQELENIFKSLEIEIENLPEKDKDHASFAGRVYARTGGVSLSVKTVINRIAPNRVVSLQAEKVNGVKECKDILDKLKSGNISNNNFIEGMGCDGGCVGGPKTNIKVDEAKNFVNEFGEESTIMTPMDNMNIIKILQQIGYNNFEDIFEKELIEFLSRKELKKE